MKPVYVQFAADPLGLSQRCVVIDSIRLLAPKGASHGLRRL